MSKTKEQTRGIPTLNIYEDDTKNVTLGLAFEPGESHPVSIVAYLPPGVEVLHLTIAEAREIRFWLNKVLAANKRDEEIQRYGTGQ